jgi:AraC-like DNA-binding protein
MDYHELLPPPPLDRIVHRFWFLRGDGSGEAQTIVPDGRVEIVLHLGEPFAQMDEAGLPRPQPRAIAAGQLTSPLRLLPRAGAEVVGIRLRTAAARRLLRVAQRELTGRIVPLGEVARLLEPRLLDAVRAAADSGTMIKRLGTALAHALDGARPDPIEAAVARLESGRARAAGELAVAVGLTPRTLQRRFMDEIGVDPTLLRRIIRFRAAFVLLEKLPPGRWGRVAPHAGYFDQAHLVREFRRFAGAPPSVFFGAGPELARAFSGAPAHSPV